MKIDEILFTKYEQEFLDGKITLKEENDGLGVVIDKWDMPIPRPTPQEIASYETSQLPIFKFNELKKQLDFAIENHLNDVARSKKYFNALHCISFFNSSISLYKSEATSFLAWRDLVVLEVEKVKNGTIIINTIEDFIKQLPLIIW